NATIDRESAYELLNAKIDRAEKLAEKEDTPSPKSPTRTRSRRASTRQNPIIKVLTSATFIRGVLGVLKKAMR
ncbi:MAG: ATPase, partial [Arenibacter sp.]|nr:ATPase [Arenibacter sp.]